MNFDDDDDLSPPPPIPEPTTRLVSGPPLPAPGPHDNLILPGAGGVPLEMQGSQGSNEEMDVDADHEEIDVDADQVSFSSYDCKRSSLKSVFVHPAESRQD